jgi:uncharacterized protein (TIGR03067 family)
MRTLSQLKVCVVAGLVLAGAVGCSKQSQPARPRLDGHWTGYDVQQPDAKCTVAINGNQLEYRSAQPLDWLRGSFVLNEQAQPVQMDFSIKEAGDISINDVGTTALMIYELRGDELRVAVCSQERPTSFAGGQGVRVLSFRRD